MEKSDYSKYILPVGGLVAMYFFLAKFGVIKSGDQRQLETNVKQLDTLAEFRPGYATGLAKQNGWKKVAITKMLTLPANLLAEKIKKAKGIFNDNESAVYTALKAVKNKAQLSQVADIFQQKYNIDMVDYLREFMNETELARVFDITVNLPTGVKQLA